jgi:hypothetical protein
MVIGQNDLIKNFFEPKPINGNLLVEFSEKESEVQVGKLVLSTENVEGYKTYLIVKDVAEGITGVSPGDIIEIVGHSVIAFHYGPDRKKLGLVNFNDVACVYKSKKL